MNRAVANLNAILMKRYPLDPLKENQLLRTLSQEHKIPRTVKKLLLMS
jgi:hypothetical protein